MINTEINTEIDLGSHYSLIIAPEDYNKIMSEQHLYIAAADNFIKHEIAEQSADIPDAEVVEIGCGPARLLPLMTALQLPHLTLVDVDQDFITYTRTRCNELSPATKVVQSSIATYYHPKPVNIFYSQGLHHHIAKGALTKQYLKNIYDQLAVNGTYILSDEFLPDYDTEEEREIKAIIWYSHIIDHAKRHNFDYLAQEEAKTLLDDLFEGFSENLGYKSQKQISKILDSVYDINTAAIRQDFLTAQQLAEKLLANLKKATILIPSGDQTMDLSRKDFKICDKVFRKEVSEIGFIIEKQRFFGLEPKIGGMIAYVLKKP